MYLYCKDAAGHEILGSAKSGGTYESNAGRPKLGERAIRTFEWITRVVDGADNSQPKKWK